MEQREAYTRIWKDLSSDKNMILFAGPRQVGKTTLAQIISRSFTNHVYFNWDIPEHRKNFLENPTFFETMVRKDPSRPLVVLDEIHKYKDWKNYLKGVYDAFSEDYLFLVSGSGRLDLYQKGGDSLAGRYLLFHLWPFTISECGRGSRDMADFLKNPLFMTMENAEELKEIWLELSERSGFPEPFLSGRTITYRRWSNVYTQQLIREDVRDLSGVKSVTDMETLYFLLPSKVGSPISIPSLARDLKASYNSVRNWLGVFERFFLTFSIGPWTKKIARAIQKERKVYIWDTPRIKDPGARFENMVAQELWRAVTVWNDLGYGAFSLHFIKNKEQQEVDFLIANEGEPLLLLEARLSDTQPSKPLRKFQDVLNIPAVQLVGESEGYRMLPNGSQLMLVAPGYQWLSLLP
jgi:predicted AAA+ superfamily ATPase